MGETMRNRKYRSPVSAGISMKIGQSSKERVEGKNLFALATPIFFEFLMVNIVGNVDIIMLGKYSAESVAAVGGLRQLLLIQNVVFGFICIGTTLLISQLLGSQEAEEVRDIIGAAILMNFFIAAILGGIYLMGYNYLLRWIRLPGSLIEVGKVYFRLVGGFCIFQALTLTYGAVMKAYGYTKEVFYINFGIHLLNIIGNSAFIFGMFGMPVLGVAGVGISTIGARGIGCLVAYRTMKRYCNFSLDIEGVRKILLKRGKKILSIGLPTGAQYLCWSFAQIIILSFVNTMGADTIEARTYLMLITSFIITFSLGLGQGTALQIGRLTGAGETDLVYRKCLRSTLIAFLTASILSIMVISNRLEIMGLFKPDEETLNIAHGVFSWFLFLETGRVFNIVITRSLHAAGDIKFPAVIGIFSPLVVGVSLAWVLGITLEYGLVGIWAANGIEEWIRGLTMLFRWKSRKWEDKKFT